jgi:uncharacterized protein (TIGR03085 family)
MYPDDTERAGLCELLDDLGPDAPTLIATWRTRDLAAHLVLRERDPVAAPGLVVTGAWGRLAERRARALAATAFPGLVATLRSGPPPGFFRLPWVRRGPSLNEFFVHHEDVRRAAGFGPRTLSPDMEEALWRNVGFGRRVLARRLRGAGLEVCWAGTGRRFRVRQGTSVARISGRPGEVLLFLFGRTAAAEVEVTGAVAAVRATRFGM